MAKSWLMFFDYEWWRWSQYDRCSEIRHKKLILKDYSETQCLLWIEGELSKYCRNTNETNASSNHENEVS